MLHARFKIRYSTFGIRHSPFDIPHSTFPIRHSPFSIQHSTFYFSLTISIPLWMLLWIVPETYTYQMNKTYVSAGYLKMELSPLSRVMEHTTILRSIPYQLHFHHSVFRQALTSITTAAFTLRTTGIIASEKFSTQPPFQKPLQRKAQLYSPIPQVRDMWLQAMADT